MSVATEAVGGRPFDLWRVQASGGLSEHSEFRQFRRFNPASHAAALLSIEGSRALGGFVKNFSVSAVAVEIPGRALNSATEGELATISFSAGTGPEHREGRVLGPVVRTTDNLVVVDISFSSPLGRRQFIDHVARHLDEGKESALVSAARGFAEYFLATRPRREAPASTRTGLVGILTFVTLAVFWTALWVSYRGQEENGFVERLLPQPPVEPGPPAVVAKATPRLPALPEPSARAGLRAALATQDDAGLVTEESRQATDSEIAAPIEMKEPVGPLDLASARNGGKDQPAAETRQPGPTAEKN
ncbi:MAG: hypothetical protein LJE84_00090 [Gammaproteobacteria bacterium]|nr:hypothetical protein [Gammaproteobacteria bacterium]